ncbi:MAG TPA: GDSL-type esterase/lipase family protein [Alphaproteobacteria bacterium]
MALATESAADPEHVAGTCAGGGAWRFVRGTAAVLAVLIAAGGALAATPCKAPKDLVRFGAPLTHLVEAFKKTKLIRVVAIGSSSTAGSGASSPHASFPAQLDDELERRFGGWDFKVTNLGVGGQLARGMFERMERDVIPREPHLVLWQTGVNDAIRDVGVDDYRKTLKDGVELLRKHAIDVVLIQMQFYPKSERVKGYIDYLRVMHEVAASEEIPVFRRFSIMKHFIKSGQFTAGQLLSPDLFHMNDLSYGCLAVLMADAIEDQVAPFLQGRATATAPAAPRDLAPRR